MPAYEFRTFDGRIVEVFGSMRNPPKGQIVLTETGWRAAEPDDRPEDVLERVWSSGLPAVRSRNYEVNWRDGGPPVDHGAKIIPGGQKVIIEGREMRRHAGGLITDSQGRPVIRNKRDSENANAAARALGVHQVWD